MMPFALEACTWAFNAVGGWARMEEVGRRLQDSDSDPFQEPHAAFLIVIVSVGLAEIAGTILFMIMYKNNVTSMRQPMPMGLQHAVQSGDFVTGECSCFEDINTCLHGFCCPMCRVGDTYEAAGLNTYYGVICTVLVLSFVIGIANVVIALVVVSVLQPQADDPQAVQNANQLSNTIAQLVRAAIFGGVFTQYRRQLRLKLGGRDEAVPYIKDFLCWGCCTPCVICQEARELDKAMGVQVACCCKLQVGAPAAVPILGQAVMMAPGQAPMPGQMMQGQMMQGQMMQGQQGQMTQGQ